MSNKRVAILELFCQGKRQCEIVCLLNVPEQTVSKAINWFKKLGHKGDRPGRERNRIINNTRNQKIIKKRVQQNSRVSMRKIVRDTDINCESVRQIAERSLTQAILGPKSLTANE